MRRQGSSHETSSKMESHQPMKQPENNRVRLPVLVLCTACLLLSGLLIWWGKTDHTSSSTNEVDVLGKGQMASQQSAGLPKSLARGDMASVRSPTIVPIFNDPADDLLERVQRLFATGNSADRDLVYTNLLPALVRMNPSLAAQFAESTKSDLLRTDTLRTVAQTWALLDSEGAIGWAAQLPETAERNLELGYVCTEIASTDPTRAVQVVEQSGLGERTEAVLENIAQKWAAQDFPEAKAWAMAEPSGERRDTLLARIACVRAATAPVEAAQLIVDGIPSGSIQTEVVLSVISQWGVQDMAGVTAWVALFPPGPMKAYAEQQLSGIAAYQNAPPEGQN